MKTIYFLFLALVVVTGSVAIGKTNRIRGGSGSFVFRDLRGNKNKPITIWYYMPKEPKPKMPVVFVMHGVKRNGQEYRNAWVKHAEKEKFLLLVPEFTAKLYPGSRQYNLGNMFLSSGKPINKSKWTYTAIEHIFDHVRSNMGVTAEKYSIYGHSAGAQFVHRLVMFVPEARIDTAISANAGWYTMPTFRFKFPYGLKDSSARGPGLKQAFTQRLIVLLGDKDIDPNHKHLRKTPKAMAQGRHRFERGENFYKVASRETARLKTPLNWKLRAVKGVGHSNSGMAKAAITLLINRALSTDESTKNPSQSRPMEANVASINDSTSRRKSYVGYTEKLDTPDLMQTDPDGRLPDGGKKYCAPVAVSNSFMWLAENGFENLAPKLRDRKTA